MKIELKKGLLRLPLILLIPLAFVIFLLFNPSFFYNRETQIENYTIYHQQELDPQLGRQLAKVDSMLRKSELYEERLDLKICLNEGAVYPQIMKALWGDAFGWGMSNIVVINGEMDLAQNIVTHHGYQWNLEQLLLHELTHCLQFHTFGLWNSNPFAKYPKWKWEGYAEYIARQGKGQHSLLKNMERIESARMVDPDEWGVFFEDKTVAPRQYYDYWLMVQYCMEVKKMSYRKLLKKKINKEELEEEMMMWYDLKVRN
ncbi:hypothetical protein [Flammeovirga aprica]|uniref:Uncharacterized protein n=1 Tax=Flammeovirga aprica JL-4 TaxID=694437 RepID=A0A7X9RTG3_9BACT|nr:hypothetical protein [Flammeovirga aprica]NME68460.1 hypothetical protein [Flammeovirga aprica JL-4]